MAPGLIDQRTGTIRAGIVGCGFFGRLLARTLNDRADVEVTRVTDRSAEAAQELAGELGCAVSGDADHLVNEADVDLVVIATPNHAHVEPVLLAAAAGKQIFVEKPMALHVADCERMLAAAASAEVALIVGHIMRCFPAVKEMRRAIDAGEIGDVIHGRSVLMRWSDLSAGPANWWKLDPAQTGGELVHEIHGLDLLCWFLGEPRSAFARSANLAHPELPDYHDVHQVAIEFKSGALATLELGTAYHLPEWSCTIGGTKGALRLDLRAATLLTRSEDGSERLRGLFDDEHANASLYESVRVARRGYNTSSTTPPYWMAHAAALEMDDVINYLDTGARTVLLDAPDRAIRAAELVAARERRGG